MLFMDPRIAVLSLLLIAAAISDLRSRRIPNVLVLGGLLFGIAYNIALPPTPQTSFLFPFAGILVGFFIFLPLYLIRATGAGDVKLLAMIGAFLGPLATLNSAIATFIVGGVLALAYAIQRGTASRMVENLVVFMRLGVLGALAGSPSIPRLAPEKSAGRLPYAISIALGTLGYLVLHQLGFA